MSTALAKTESLADLLERLGGIAPCRVRMHPPPGKAKVRDVTRIQDHEGRLFELVDGVLVEKVMGFYEGGLAIVLAHLLESFLDNNDLGVVTGADTTVQLVLSLVRIPDVAFVSWGKFPDRELPAEAVPLLVPDLAVEIISEGNTPAEMLRKLGEYFDAGVRLVWYIYPKTRTAKVYTSVEDVEQVAADGTLTGGDVLPGFTLPLKKLFDRAGRRPTQGGKRSNGRRQPKNGRKR